MRRNKKYYNGKPVLSNYPKYVYGGTFKKTKKRNIKSFMKKLWYKLRGK